MASLVGESSPAEELLIIGGYLSGFVVFLVIMTPYKFAFLSKISAEDCMLDSPGLLVILGTISFSL